MKWYNTFRYHVAPPFVLVGATASVQVMAVVGSGNKATWSLAGDSFGWTVIAVLFSWSLISLWVPGRTYKGPTTPFGYTPEYKDNGFSFFIISLSSFITLIFFKPKIALDITAHFPQILAASNMVALILCIWLLIKGKYFPETGEQTEPKPILFEFFRGMEVHPRILGADVKQLTNSRYGLISWQLLVICFLFAGYQKHGFSLPHTVSVILQTIYLGKFYWWETGYFHTLDITLDRAGYYICWGCLVWVPSLYNFNSYFLVEHPSQLSDRSAVVILILGLLSIALNYRVDWEKEYFRKQNGKCHIWGKPATYIEATYNSTTGKRDTALLTSGFWGMARHTNYVFELLLAILWCLPGLGYGLWPFIYVMFLSFLLVHRTFRDEEKCAAKYGEFWTKYCQKVPYRYIPGIL